MVRSRWVTRARAVRAARRRSGEEEILASRVCASRGLTYLRESVPRGRSSAVRVNGSA